MKIEICDRTCPAPLLSSERLGVMYTAKPKSASFRTFPSGPPYKAFSACHAQQEVHSNMEQMGGRKGSSNNNNNNPNPNPNHQKGPRNIGPTRPLNPKQIHWKSRSTTQVEVSIQRSNQDMLLATFVAMHLVTYSWLLVTRRSCPEPTDSSLRTAT